MKRWGGIFDIDKKIREIEEEEEKTLNPNFWDDPKKAEEQLKLIQSKKNWTNTFSKCVNQADDAFTMMDFLKEGLKQKESETWHSRV